MLSADLHIFLHESTIKNAGIHVIGKHFTVTLRKGPVIEQKNASDIGPLTNFYSDSKNVRHMTAV